MNVNSRSPDATRGRLMAQVRETNNEQNGVVGAASVRGLAEGSWTRRRCAFDGTIVNK